MNVILLAVGIFIEPLPALYILAPFLAPVAAAYGIDPVHFGLIMVFNLVLALIHPPIGLVHLPGVEHRQGLGGAIVDHDPALAGGQPGGPLPGHLPAERGRPGPLEPDRLRSANALGVAAMLGWGVAYVPSAWLVETLAAAQSPRAPGWRSPGSSCSAPSRLSGRPLRPGAGPMTIGWLALTQTVLFYGATFWGIAHAGAGLAAVLANTDPLFVAALAAGFLGEQLKGRQWVGLPVGLVGAAVVVWEGPLWPPADRAGGRGAGGRGAGVERRHGGRRPRRARPAASRSRSRAGR